MNKIMNAKKGQAGSSDSSIAEIVYISYLVVLYFVRGIGCYEGQLLFNIALVIGLLLFGGKVLLTKHSFFEYLAIVLFIALGAIIYYKTGEKWFLLNITMLLGIKGIDPKKALNAVFYVLIITFTVCFVLCMTGLVEPLRMLHPKTGLGYVLCYGMIYAHPNSLHSMFLLITALTIYKVGLVKGKKLLLFLVALIITNLYIFLYTFSYTGFLTVNILIFLYVVMCIRESISKFGKVILQLIFPFCLVFSMIGPLVIKGKAFDLINKLLSTRYNLSRYFLTEQPKTLFGTIFVIPDYLEHYTMDCSYVYLFMQYGIIAFILMCIGYFMLINYQIRKNMKLELAITLAFCIGGIAEPYLFNSSFKNITLIFMGLMFYENISGKIESSVLSKSFQILNIESPVLASIGDMDSSSKEIAIKKPKLNEGGRMARPLKNSDPKYLKLLAIPAIIGIICTLIFVLVTDNINGLYISEALNQARSSGAPVLYLTEDQVSELEDEGYEVLDYISVNEPMYAYFDKAGTMEYARRVVSVMLWSFVLTIIIELIYIQKNDHGSYNCE